MDRYRLYIFDKAGRTVAEEREFIAMDDVVASRMAEGWRSTNKAVLWCANREVTKWSTGQRRRS